MNRTELGIIFLLIISIAGCSGKGESPAANIGPPDESAVQRALESNWSYIRWTKFEKTGLEERSVAGAPVYVMKFKAEGSCLKAGRGCQTEGEKVAWRDGVVGFERTATGWQPGLPRGDIGKL
jgi:hypothetical protein